jgi:hypothetical protein
MKSRLLSRLDAAIARTRDPVQLACLRAERAGFLGRHGRIDLARGQLQEIQRQFAAQPHVAVSGWVALAEGQLDHYTSLAATAHDRFRRAHAYAAAAGLTALQALAAAWLAHSEDVRNHRERMAALCAEAWGLAAADHHGARWRAALTVAGAYHFAGEFERAQPWYAAARRHAQADGDEVALSALMYNQTALRAMEVRFAAAFDPSPAGPSGAVLGAESTRQFDAVIGLKSLDWLVPLLRAQLLVLEAKHAQALALFDEHAPRSEAAWRARMEPGLLADRAWCLAQLDRLDEARAQAELAAAMADTAACDVDDRALAHARLAQLFGTLGEGALAERHRTAAEADREAHRAAQRALLQVLERELGALKP